MSAWADEADGAAGDGETVGDEVAARVARRFFAGGGWGLRAAARRGLADGCAVDDPPGSLLRGALG